MGRNCNASRVFLVIWILFAFKFIASVAEICQKVDDCSCKKSNGKIINLRKIDGGSTPAFRNVKDKNSMRPFVYAWNPCTKFSEGDGCKDVLVCQQATDTKSTFPIAATVTGFKVNSDGTTSVTYQQIDYAQHKRVFEIRLICDESKYPGEIDAVKEVQEYPLSAYVFRIAHCLYSWWNFN
ncbi:hypothetical protein ACROYT_G024744 [Oculina patagonica]